MDEIAKLFVKLTEQYGPHAVEAVRGAAIVEAWSNLQGAIMAGAFTVGSIFVIKRLWKSSYVDDLDFNYGKIAAVVLTIIATITGVICIGSLTDPWLWVTFNNPDLWIAKKVFKL